MTDVSFHFNVPDRSAYLCRLLRKAVRQGARAVVTGPGPELKALDCMLWSFDPLEFVPHVRPAVGQAIAPRLLETPIWLLEDLGAAGHRDVLVNLGIDAPEGFERFARLIEVVSADADDRVAARARWKHYAAHGHAIETHEAGG